MASRSGAILDASKSYSPSAVPHPATALLLLDYQHLMVSAIANPDVRARVQNAASSLRTWALAHGVLVYHCSVDLAHTSEPVPTAKLTARWESQLRTMMVDRPILGATHPEFRPDELESGEAASTRQLGRLSALSDPVLEQDLKTRGVRHLIVCGISTSAVVLSTARTATEAGYIVTVASDGCFDANEELSNMLLEHVLPTSAHVLTSEEIINEFR